MKWIKKRINPNSLNKFNFIKLLTLADSIILLLAISLIIGLMSRYWFHRSQPASYAIITIANKSPLRIKLDHTEEIHLTGNLGESVLVVEPGKIRFIASPCHGKQCIHAGWLNHGGDFSACLPNKISVTIENAATEQFDSIAY